MRAFIIFALIVAIAFIVADRVLADDLSDLTELIETDYGGNLRSHMFLAAYHGYNVSSDGLVYMDGQKLTIWPKVGHLST